MEQLLSDFLRTGELSDAVKILETCQQPRIGLSLAEFIYKLFPNNPGVILGLAKNAKNCGLYRLAYDAYSRLGTEILKKEEHLLIPKISDEYIFYPAEIVQNLMIAKQKPFPMITFTITTCKRYDLFEKTMNSFLNCCIDVNLIDKWLCVDDNSSDEDRKKMKEKYPFFEFYFKTFQEKGHPQSMNIIREKVDTPYTFHMEDDWKFFKKHPYITECLTCLSIMPSIGQCLINQNYAETEKDSRILGGILVGEKYYLHEYCKNEEDYSSFYEKHGQGAINCAYWPHFSFRPSLLKTSIMKTLGKFEEKISHFELEYSKRYVQAGHVSAFLPGISCLHIGRLTSEREDMTKQNAYVLNDEKQLYGREEVSQVPPSQVPPSQVPPPSEVEKKCKVLVLNLDRRQDRMEKFSERALKEKLNFTKFSAIDGNRLVPTEQLQRIFEGNDYNMRSGMVGCALSHLLMWNSLVSSKEESYCILEDDVEFVPDFCQKLEHVYRNLPKDWDLCYLGHHVWDKYRSEDVYDKKEFPNLEKWDTITSLTFSMGGTGGYLISKKGASGLLDFIEKKGMTNGIDTMQQKSADILDVYYCKPHLIYSECYTKNHPTDTDIQLDRRSLTIPFEVRIENLLQKYRNAIQTSDHAIALKYIQDEKSESPMLYTGEYVKPFLEISKHPCYHIEYKALMIIPKSPPLKRLDLAEAIVYKSNSRKLISLGETTHVVNFLKNLSPNIQSFPFDLLDGETMETISYILEITLKMTQEELSTFVKDFCGRENNTVETLPYNGKEMLKNSRYRISFPHENVEELVPVYTEKFSNLFQAIKSDCTIAFFHVCHFTQDYSASFYRLLDLMIPMNQNVKILTVNGFPKDKEIEGKYKPHLYRDYVDFPEHFRNTPWTMEKVRYDQEEFRPRLAVPITKFLAKMS